MTDVNEVRSTFVTEDGCARPGKIPASVVTPWLRESNLEVRGALYQFLRQAQHSSRVIPPLASEDVHGFMLSYFEACIATPQEVASRSPWILSGGDLSHAIACWARDYWQAHANEPQARKSLIAWLERILLAHPHFRNLLAPDIGEHVLLADRRRQKHFAHWASHPVLGPLFPELTEAWDRSKIVTKAPPRRRQ